MSKILSLNDVRSLREAYKYVDLKSDNIMDLFDTVERYACAIENNWAVQNYCKYCGAVIQEWPSVRSMSPSTPMICHHSLDCVVMQVKGAG